MIENILLDFDGTVADSFEAVYDALSHTLSELRLRPITEEALRPMLGIPTRKILNKFLDSPECVDAALGRFRFHYARIEAFKMKLYPGIEEMLAELRTDHFKVFICTVRPRLSAERALNHLGVRRLIDEVYGADLDGRFENKADLIAHILEVEQISPTSVLMVGDRGSDVLSAASQGIRTIAVAWGYGSLNELRGAGAASICNSARELPSAIRARSRILTYIATSH